MASDFSLGWENATLAWEFLHTDFDQSIRQELKRDLEELALLIQYRIRGRTPESDGSDPRNPMGYTGGALKESISYEIDSDPNSDELITFLALDEPQLEAWGRVYAPYVEGLPLGATSPTIYEPAQMFFRVETDDMDIIDAWMQGSINQSLDTIVTGQGIQI